MITSFSIPLPSSRCLARRLVVLLVCLSLGMHWTLLQGIAWTGMLLSFATQGSVIEAVEKTFDGAHPCPLCLAVKKSQEQEKDDTAPASAKSLKKHDAVLVAANRLIPPPARPWSHGDFMFNGEGRPAKPSTPPPRV